MKTQIDIYVATQVRKIRRSKRISQSLLSFGIGVSKSFVGQVESAAHPSKYNVNHLYEIARFLDCSMSDFFPDKSL
ncbi:MAG: helix-turn-helix transcriptional regulator [Rikenellaceae bacterium]